MKIFRILSAVGLALMLAACSPAPDTGKAGEPGLQPLTTQGVASLSEQLKGFETGSKAATRTVYVIFDPQCPHCAEQWKAAKELEGQVRFVWAPVAFVAPASLPQGAAILSDEDPAATMDAHEASLAAHQGGISASANLDPAVKAGIERNLTVLKSLGASSVPLLVTINAAGQPVQNAGTLAGPALRQFVGL